MAPGDRVRATLRDGTRVDGEIEAVNAESIAVRSSESTQRIPWSDVTKLERREVSGGKTALLTIGLTVVGVLAVLFFVLVGTDGDFM